MALIRVLFQNSALIVALALAFLLHALFGGNSWPFFIMLALLLALGWRQTRAPDLAVADTQMPTLIYLLSRR